MPLRDLNTRAECKKKEERLKDFKKERLNERKKD